LNCASGRKRLYDKENLPNSSQADRPAGSSIFGPICSDDEILPMKTSKNQEIDAKTGHGVE
jgi:hypothetical protein